MAPASADNQRRFQALQSLLRKEPRSAQELMAALGVSQPTLSRTIQAFPESLSSFRLTGDRTPRYALLRKLPGGLDPRQIVYKVSGAGTYEEFARVEFLSGGATLERGPTGTVLYGGLPPYMAFSAPNGFLGRQVARDAAASERHFPESLKDWGDDHRVSYLFTQALNPPGNLVYGADSRDREMQWCQTPAVSAGERLARYEAAANQLSESAYGSSAGGEQPKFLSLTEDAGHVIVKFARRGTRMADLLPLEHLALRSLGEVGVPASLTRLAATANHVFLEVQRFDRLGRHGRIGMLSGGSIDDEFFGARDTWSEFAARCESAGYLSAEDARYIDTMAAFSELIGNGDRHFDNISLLVAEDGEYKSVAPAYDILPMRYAPIGAGIDPKLLPITPKLGTIGASADVWRRAADAANRFWTAVQQERTGFPVSGEFRELAARNLAIAQEFAKPLLPPT
jgi:hypothetical protein